MINEYINELVAYGLNQGLVDPEDEVYVTNRLLELFQLTEHEGTAKEVRSERELSQIFIISLARQQIILEKIELQRMRNMSGVTFIFFAQQTTRIPRFFCFSCLCNITRIFFRF